MRIYCAAVVLGDTDQSFVIVFIKLQGLLLSVIYIGADDLRNRQLFLYDFRRNLLRMVNSDAVSALKSASLLFVMLLITTSSLVVLLKEITVRLEIGLPYSALIVLPFALQDGTAAGSAAKALCVMSSSRISTKAIVLFFIFSS